MEGRDGTSTANRSEVAEPSADPAPFDSLHAGSAVRPLEDMSPGPWWATLLAASAIIAVTVAAYWHSLDGEFMFDDRVWIVESPSIKHLWPLSDVLLPADAAHVGGRPIVSVSLAVNYALGGLDVRGYHAVNLAIHICAALVRRCTANADSAAATRPLCHRGYALGGDHRAGLGRAPDSDGSGLVRDPTGRIARGAVLPPHTILLHSRGGGFGKGQGRRGKGQGTANEAV